ncbi:hypothetical protein KJ567_06395 [Candidatus Bipolaricaulota bacterium]|nr:hypothetical protein [Candidatus Bipolaricaulota bacterium]
MAGRISLAYAIPLLVGVAVCTSAFAPEALASPSIGVDIGLGGMVVDERFAPCVVSLSGLTDPVLGTLIVEQQVGNAWKGSALIRLELAEGWLDNGSWSLALPLYDPLNRVSFSLLDASGDVLAIHDVDLRPQRRLDSFPVACSILPLPAEEGIVNVHPEDLPLDWASYEAVSRLWLAAPPSPDAQRAIAQWVLAGGALVVLTGEDFFRLDTPLLRELLPISDPQLTSDPSGAFRLTGHLRPSASEIASRDGQQPLAYSWPYGAGHVTVLTASAASLEPVDFASLLPQLHSAALLSLGAATETLLANTTVSRPSHLIAVLIIVGGVAWLSVATRWSRRRGRPAIGWVLLGVLCLSVLSGFMSNRGNRYILTYTLNTTLSVQTSYSSTLHCLATLGFEGGARSFALSATGLPLADVPDSLHGLRFDITAEADMLHLTLQPNELRTLRTYGASQWPLSFAAGDSDVTIDNHGSRLGKRVSLVIRRGLLYHIAAIEPGSRQYELEGGQDPETYTGPLQEIVRALDAQFAFHARDWLLAIDEHETLVDHGELLEKVRYLDIHLIGGDVVHGES